MGKMGGMSSMMDKMPGAGQLPQNVKSQVNDKEFHRMEAIINSMTAMERRRPVLIKGSRKRRIANGSGTKIQDVNRLLKQFAQMQKMMKKVSKKGGLKRMMRGMQGMMGGGSGPGGMGGMGGLGGSGGMGGRPF
jgi:signal recognition particle subunit SRP54